MSIRCSNLYFQLEKKNQFLKKVLHLDCSSFNFQGKEMISMLQHFQKLGESNSKAYLL